MNNSRNLSSARTAKLVSIGIIAAYIFAFAIILCALSSSSSSSSSSTAARDEKLVVKSSTSSTGQTPSQSYSPLPVSRSAIPAVSNNNDQASNSNSNNNNNNNNKNIPKFEAGSSHLNIEGIQRGISVESIRAGQHHLTLQLVGGSARFARHLSNEDRLALLRKLFNSVPADAAAGIVHADFATGTWDTYKGHIFSADNGALTTVSTSGRSMKITLGSAKDFELDVPERILISSVSGGEWIPSELLVRGSSISSASSKDFVVFPDGRLDISVIDTGTPMVSHTVLLDVGLVQNANTTYPLKLMSGRDCRKNSFMMDVPWPRASTSNTNNNKKSSSPSSQSHNSEESTIVEFVPISGAEQVTICYVPHGEEVSTLLQQEPIYIAATTTLAGAGKSPTSSPYQFSISGPTYSGTRSLAVGETAKTQILGFNLTYDDVAALSPSGQCDAVDINNALPLPMYIASTSLAEVQVQAQEVGVYDLCYFREGAASFVPVASYAVTHTDGKHKTHDVNVSKGISVDLSGNVYSANFRVLDGGVVRLNSHQVNTTHFEWRDGTIEGWGGINCQAGPEPHVIEAAASREISVQIQNFGNMFLHVDHLHFSGQGAIHNHRHLTIVAESPRALMNTADHLARRIVNGVRGRIDFVIGSSSAVAEVLHPVVISTALIENLGMIVVSPNMQVNFRRFTNLPTGIFQLHFGSTALIEAGSIEGELEADSDSVLGFAGDVSLAGTTFVTADKSHLLFNAVHYLKLANVHVRGSGQIFIHSLVSSNENNNNNFGPSSRSTRKGVSGQGIVVLEGTTTFDKNTILAVKNATLVAERNIAYMNVLGRFVCHVPSVILGDNIVLSAHLNSVLFGSGSESARVVPQRNPPNNSAFVLPENASLILVDVDNSNGFYRSSNNQPSSKSSTAQSNNNNQQQDEKRSAEINSQHGATTQVCSQYLVVPVHVVLSGDVQLLGCVMLPIGGQSSGSIYSSSAADIIEATSQFAFCKTALSGRSSGRLGTTGSGAPTTPSTTSATTTTTTAASSASTTSSSSPPHDNKNKNEEDIEKIVKVPGDVCISLGSGDETDEYALIEKLFNAKRKQQQQQQKSQTSNSNNNNENDAEQTSSSRTAEATSLDPAVAPNANLALGGTFVFIDETDDRSRNGAEVVQSSTIHKMKAQLDIERLEVLPQAVLEATAVVKLLVKRGILVRPESAIALSLGGLIGSTILTLEGTLVLDSNFPLLINGTMQAESTASLVVRAWDSAFAAGSSSSPSSASPNSNALAHYFGDKSGSSSSSNSAKHKQLTALYNFFTGNENNNDDNGAYCSYPLQVAGGCTFLTGSRIVIDTDTLTTSTTSSSLSASRTYSDALPLVHSNLAIVGSPLIKRIDEERENHVAANANNSLVTISIITRRSVSAASQPTIELPTPYRKKLAVCFLVIVGAAATLYFYARVGRKFVDELLAEPTYPMWLGIAEFWNSLLNWIAVGAILLEVFLLCAPAFHQSLFIPDQLDLARWMLSWMVSANHDAGSWQGPAKYYVLFSLLFSFVVMWLWLYVVRSDPESQRFAGRMKQRLFSGVQQFCTVMTFVGLTLFIPVTATLMEPITCKFLFYGAYDCHHAEQYLVVGTLGLVAFLVLAPLSGTSLTTPFSHPPFMRDLDIRYKRTFIHLQCVLFGAMISCWKIFSRNAFQLQLAHLLILTLLFFLYRYSHPCIYENINVIRQALYVIPFFGSLAALIQLVRYDGRPRVAACDMTVEYGYVLVFLFGIVLSIALIVRFLYQGQNPAEFPSVDRAASAARTAVLYCFREVERIQLRMYNASSSSERALYAEELADRKVEYQHALQVLRKQLAPLQTKYYLGEDASHLVALVANNNNNNNNNGNTNNNNNNSNNDTDSNNGDATSQHGNETDNILRHHHHNSTTANYIDIMNRLHLGMTGDGDDDDAEELQPMGTSSSSNQWLVDGQPVDSRNSNNGGKRKLFPASNFGYQQQHLSSDPLKKNNNGNDDENQQDNNNNDSGASAGQNRNNNNNNKNDFPSCNDNAIATAEELKELTPEQMSNYTEGPILGRGTYGTVYMAMLSIGKLVAVKVVPIVKKQKAESLNSIKREVDVLRNMSHPNVIRCYGCSYPPKKDSICIFMELATSGSLTQIVRRFGGLGENIVQVYTKQILKGLQYLHGRGVIHRDIKGENILIDGNGAAKLGDFGCSKYLQDVANKSQAGCASLVGSPFWMAPEVIRNEKYGTKADVWSLGCTVVEMLNGGHPPWSETFDNVYSAMYFIGNTTSLPSNIPDSVSDLCKDFLSKCFERDVSKRSSVTDLLNHPWLSESNMGSPLGADQLHIAIQHGHNISGTSHTNTHNAESSASPSHVTSFNTNSRQNSGFSTHNNNNSNDNNRRIGAASLRLDDDGGDDENDEEEYDDDDQEDVGSDSSLRKPPPKVKVVQSKNNNNNSASSSSEAAPSTPSTTRNNNQNGGRNQQQQFMPGRGWSGLFDGLASSGGAGSHMTGDSTFNPSTLDSNNGAGGSTF